MRLLRSKVAWRKMRRICRIIVGYAKSYLFFQGWQSWVWRESESKTKPICVSTGMRFCADPFLFRYKNENYLFYESVDKNEKGYVGCMRANSSALTNFGSVLVEPWHLSYPQVIEEDGKVYMVPESCDFGNGCVPLYEAVAFPLKWTKIAVLVDKPFADATLLKHEDHWYMACYTIPPCESAELWHAPSLMGPWERHPCWDKINQSKRLRRCGGHYIRRGDELYRVAQDCNGPLYGKRLFKVEVNKLTPTEYEEGEATPLYDRNLPPYGYCHTYNEIELSDSQRLCVVDVHHNVLKWPHQILGDVCKAVMRKLKR